MSIKKMLIHKDSGIIFSPFAIRSTRYNFESWREFSYQDEENPEKGEWLVLYSI